MSLMPRYFAPLLVSAGVAAPLAMAPLSAADPALPTAGSENAADTISAYQAQGYDVQINWDNGVPNTDLSQCWVNSIDTAAAASGTKTVYIDVECPK